MAAIEIKNLTKRYKERTAVNNLSLTIEKGEFFALLGQNGAGKTTTIKMLSCLASPSEGDAIILNDSIKTNPDAIKAKLNVSPQETAVAPLLTVRENLVFIAQIYGCPLHEANKRAEEMMKRFSLLDRANDRARTLSGGLQRRLSIAMALISEPEIIFLDEPTLGLDVRARRDLWKILEEMHGKLTVILTTHYLEEAESLADRIAIMDKGELKILGTAQELKEKTGKETLEDVFLSLTEPTEE